MLWVVNPARKVSKQLPTVDTLRKNDRNSRGSTLFLKNKTHLTRKSERSTGEMCSAISRKCFRGHQFINSAKPKRCKHFKYVLCRKYLHIRKFICDDASSCQYLHCVISDTTQPVEGKCGVLSESRNKH